LGKLRRFTLAGSECKMLIVDTGPALLLVALQRDVNMGLVNLEIKEATNQVVEKAKM